METFLKDKQYYKFCAYGFLKNLRFFDAFLLLFFLEVGVSYGEVGILYAIREIVINITEIPSGIIADSFGRKSALMVAFFFYIGSFVVFYFSNNFWLLSIAMIVYGFGDAFRSGTNKGMIMDYLRMNNWEGHKVNYYGHTRSWSQRGSAISSLIAGILVLYSGSYRAIFLFAIVPYLLNLINVGTYPKAINHSQNKKTRGNLVMVFKDLKKVVQAPGVFSVMNSAALHSSYLKAIKDYIQPIMIQVAIILPFWIGMEEKKKGGLVVGILYFIIYLLTSKASKSAGTIAKKGIAKISKSTLLFGLGSGLFSGLLVWQELWFGAIIFFVLVYVIENIRKPILTGLLSNHVPNEILTSVISTQNFYGTIITSAMAITLGFTADHFGVGVALVSLSTLLLVATFFVRNLQTVKVKNRNV